jgi:restriction system protein
MTRRGYFAELQHKAQIAAQDRERAQRIAVQKHNAAVRLAEQNRKATELAERQRVCADEAERKRLEKDARESHIAAAETDAEERNHKLEEVYDQVDSLLTTSLKLEHHVDLKTLQTVLKHPPFNNAELENLVPAPDAVPYPLRPILISPEPPKGLLANLFGKAKHAEAITNAERAHAAALSKWRAKCEELKARHRSAMEAHARADANRVTALAAAQARYAEQCVTREAEAVESNKRLDEFIANFGYGTGEAVHEYVSIVLANSLYPEQFTVTHEYAFEPSSSELTLRTLVPKPESIPGVKAYKYSKATDETTATNLSPKACRDRYENAVHQVALRSLHEIFESDRRGLIKTIRLEVGTEAVDPATGRPKYVPLVVVGVERGVFLQFNLSAVIPKLTLERLGAAVSKNPYGLAAADVSGVRRT